MTAARTERKNEEDNGKPPRNNKGAKTRTMRKRKDRDNECKDNDKGNDVQNDKDIDKLRSCGQCQSEMTNCKTEDNDIVK